MPSMDQWVCDVCKVKKFKTFEEACRHEEDCRKQQEQPDTTETPKNETTRKPEEEAPQESVAGGGVKRKVTPDNREQGDDPTEGSPNSDRKRKREASTNNRQRQQDASVAAGIATSEKQNEVSNNQEKERDQAEVSTCSAREWDNPATPASTTVCPPAAVTPERRSNISISNNSHSKDRNRSVSDSPGVCLSRDQAKYLERLKTRNPVRDQKGSGSWALLRVFHEHVQSHDNDSEDDNAAFTKTELIKKAQDYCLKVMEDTVISGRGSATHSILIGEWQCMKTLEKKELVKRTNKGSKGHFFRLTIQGKSLCQKLFSSISSSNQTQTGAKHTEQSTPSPKKTMLHYFSKK